MKGNETMEAIIRKAVSLADGWEFPETPAPTYCAPDFNHIVHGHFTDYITEMPQWHKDALAAQLVRQALGASCDIQCIGNEVVVWDNLKGYAAVKKASVIGKDRTENTLKAIVQSKVLEQ